LQKFNPQIGDFSPDMQPQFGFKRHSTVRGFGLAL
jgi:hypothetical protein